MNGKTCMKGNLKGNIKGELAHMLSRASSCKGAWRGNAPKNFAMALPTTELLTWNFR